MENEDSLDCGTQSKKIRAISQSFRIHLATDL